MAHADGTLSGRLITQDESITIKGFPVIVEGASGTFVTTTDSEGFFELPGLPPGEYEVSPANEPHLVKSVTLEESPSVRFWRRSDSTESVDVGNFHLQADKSYIEE